MIKVYCDGGARGNPGPAAAGFVVYRNDRQIFQVSRYLGRATNNQAEYQAIILAFEWLTKNSPIIRDDKVVINLDSQLAVNQLTGVYKIKSDQIKPLAAKVKRLESSLSNQVIFQHVGRNQNKVADSLVNIELDRQ